MIRLLDTCIRVLKNAETNKLFIDGIKGGGDGFSELGFRKWARYIVGLEGMPGWWSLGRRMDGIYFARRHET
jgi:hypothetical protein